MVMNRTYPAVCCVPDKITPPEDAAISGLAPLL